MTNVEPSIKPIPKIFVLDPHSENSPTAIRLINPIAEYDTFPVRESEDSDRQLLFNRFPLPELFYMFGNYGAFSVANFIATYSAYDFYVTGYILALDSNVLDSEPYKKRLKAFLDDLRNTDKPYLIAVFNPGTSVWDTSGFRAMFDVSPTIKIIQFDESTKRVSQVFQAFFQLDTGYTDEQRSVLIEALQRTGDV